MKMKFALLFAATLAFAYPASAVVLGFEDLNQRLPFGDGEGGQGNWDSYQGFVWGFGNAPGLASRRFDGSATGWASATISNEAFPPEPGNTTGQSYAWTYDGPQSLWIDFQAATTVNAADFAKLSPNFGANNSLTVQAFGYDSSNVLVGSTAPILLSTSFQTSTIGFTGARYLELRSNLNESWFSVDNLVLNESAEGVVPEPAAWVTLIFGFGVVGGVMRIGRRRPARRAAA
jgi:hypothetical protein